MKTLKNLLSKVFQKKKLEVVFGKELKKGDKVVPKPGRNPFLAWLFDERYTITHIRDEKWNPSAVFSILQPEDVDEEYFEGYFAFAGIRSDYSTCPDFNFIYSEGLYFVER